MTLPMHSEVTLDIYYMTCHCFFLISLVSLLFLISVLLLLLLLLLMMDEGWSSRPLTTSQLQEFERQTLVFNYMVLGIPVPSHLVLPFKRSYSSGPFSLHPSMNFGRKAEEDPEPWRCKRTDGKKWRCSRDALGDSKYCERHRHRGKRCLTKTAGMPLLTSPSYSSCSHFSSSSSSYTSPPLALRLGAPYRSYDESNVHSSGQENADEKQQGCCLVFGADLKLQKPMSLVRKNRKAQSPEPEAST